MLVIDTRFLSAAAELCADQAVEADAFLGGLHGQLPVHVGRDSHEESSAERATGKRDWDLLPVAPHVLDRICDDFADPSERRLLALGQPTQAGEFETEAHVFLIILGPGDPVGITIIIQTHFRSPVSLSPIIHKNDTINDTIVKPFI